MALQGWSTQMYKNGKHPWTFVTPEVLGNMAGNTWNGFAFLPVMLAAIGSVNCRSGLSFGEVPPDADLDKDFLDSDEEESLAFDDELDSEDVDSE